MERRGKKWIKYILSVTGILILIPVLIYIAVQIPAVQTIIVNKITKRLSVNLESEISIGRVEYRFFNKIALTDILFLDRNRDTLLYAEKISAGIRKIDPVQKTFALGRITLNTPAFNLITDSTGTLNLSWYIEKLRIEKDTSKNGFDLRIDRIDIENGRFSFKRSLEDTKPTLSRINYADIDLRSLNGTVEDFRLFNDTTKFNAYNLSFTEKSGFEVTRMNSNVKLSGSDVFLQSTNILTDTSSLNIRSLALLTDSSKSFRNFTRNVRISLSLAPSEINTGDVAYFTALPEGLRESVQLSGKFTGLISELRGRDINLEYGKRTLLDCDFDISGLPDIQNSFIYVGFNEFRTNATDLSSLTLPGGKSINLPEFIAKLGDISFDGSFSGFTTDFVTYGEFTSEKGSLKTDISLRPEKDSYKIRGLISGHDIDLGQLSGSELLGDINMQANIDGYATSVKDFSGDMTGIIDNVEINGYDYRNIDLKGKFTDKTWDGSINVIDDNISLDLLGLFNFKDTLPEFDFTMHVAKADLYHLNIDKKDSTAALSLLLTSNFRGNNIDNLDGEIKLINSDLTKNGKTIELYDLSIRTFSEKNSPVLSLKTDFLDAIVKGNYNFEGLKHFFRVTVANLMPSLVSLEEEPDDVNHNNFTFEINFKNTDRINDFFQTGILIADKSYIKGAVAPDTLMTLQGKADYFNLKNIVFNNLYFTAETKKSILNAELNTSSLSLPGETHLKNFNIGINTLPDTFHIKTSWDNADTILNNGMITAMGSVWKNAESNNNPVLRVDIDSSFVYISNNLWKISKSSIVLDTNSISINKINIDRANRFYHINGTISEDPSDTLYLRFKDIDISPLNYLTDRKNGKDTTRLRMKMQGQLNGNIALTGAYSDLMIESDLLLEDFSILGSDYGDITINSEFDNIKKVVDINGGNNLNGTKMFDLSGYYEPGAKSFDIDFFADRLPVGVLNPLLRSFASDISGHTTGRLKLKGSPDNLFLTGSTLADSVKVKINYLQTSYTLTDSVRFVRNGIRFNNVRFSDEEGRNATISGIVNHKNLRNYTTNLTVNMSNNFLVLNTQFRDNPMFYGRVYASGVARIQTSQDLLSFDISARTGSNTKFFIPLTDEMSVENYSFVKFIDPDKQPVAGIKTQPEDARQLGINLNIDLTVTPDAVAELIFDEKVGDKITGSGSGLLNIKLNPKGVFQITGDYSIEKGTYLFTLGNIVNKRFEVENGGRISFNGNLDDAEIELKATYQKFTASLYPVTLDPEDQQKRYAVEPQLLLSGRLFNPNVKFEIYLPNADEQVRTTLRNEIASDEALSRQFLYLLVTNSFYSEQALDNAGYSNAGTSAMASTTFEMIFNQMSNWLSQINENFNLGFNYRPGSDSKFDPDEVQIAFETQVLDDRVILNGNFDYRTNSGNTDRLTGDFEAELRITDKFRFKVFNRFNDTYYGTKGPYTQGIGIFYRENFEKITDLFKRKEKSNAKKEEEVTLSDN